MSLKKWTHDFNFVFTVTVDESDPDDISPELIAERLLETINNMDRREMFERSECFNSFEEDCLDMDYKTLVDFVLRNKVMVKYLFNLDERAKNNLITLMKEKEVVE